MKFKPLLAAAVSAGSLFCHAGLPDIAIPRTGASDISAIPENSMARIARFSPPGSSSNMPERTIVSLAYNHDTLFVRALCEDREKEEGRIFLNDDAFQIVIGSGDAGTSEMKFGGYEGAYSKQDKVQHFYEFTCRRSGILSRSYNETPLPEPCFNAQITPLENGWLVAMNIPFAAAGINPAQTPEIFFNAFRFHRNRRYGWFLPAWTPYTPLPFVKARLLSAAENREKTFTDIAAAGQKPRKTSVNTAEKFVFQYYPLQKKLLARFAPSEGKGKIAIKNGSSREVALSAEENTSIQLDVPFSEGTRFTATASKDGKVMKTIQAVVPPYPAWAETRAGEQYLNGKVPSPWKTPEFKDKTVKLAYGQIRFGTTALPDSILACGTEILSGPVRIEAVANGKTVPVLPYSRLAQTGGALLAESRNSCGIEVKTRVEYDGFMIVRLRLNGISAEKLEKLTVRIPVRRELATYILRGLSQNLVTLDQYGYRGDSGEIWLGNAAGGISFDFDRRFFFSPANGRQIEVAFTNEKTAELLLHPVTEKGQIKNPEQVFQFFLCGTPVRSDFIPAPMTRMSLWFENWSDYQGYPDLKKIPEMRKRAEQAHAQGKDFYIYFSQVLAENAPGYDFYQAEWIAPPERAWYKRAYNPGKGVPCRVVCFRGEAGNLILDGVEKCIRSASIDGVYLDGPTVPFSCENPSHSCSDSMDAVWDDSWQSGRILGQRAFLKRLRGIFDEHGRKFPIWAHTGGSLSIATLSLCDFYYDGEQLARYRQGYLLEPEKMLICYSGVPFGFRGLFLPQLYFDKNRGCRAALPWSLVHGIASSGGSILQQCYFESFAKEKGVFYPYWGEQKALGKISSGKALISYWIGENEAMLTASNLRYNGTEKVTLDLSAFFGGKEILISCLNHPEGFTFNGKILQTEIQEGEMKLFSIRPGKKTEDIIHTQKKETGEKKFFIEKPYQPEHWKTNVKNTASKEFPVKIETKRGHIAGKIEYTGFLPPEFQLTARFRHSGRLKIEVNDVTVLWDGNWVFRNFLDPEIPPSNASKEIPLKNQAVTVKIRVMEQGKIFIDYNGEPLVIRGIPLKASGKKLLAFSTWAGDSLEFDCIEFTDKIDKVVSPVPVHPVHDIQ